MAHMELCAARRDEIGLSIPANHALKIALSSLRDIERTIQVIQMWLDTIVSVEEWPLLNRVVAQVKLITPRAGLSFNDSQRLTALLTPYQQLLQARGLEPPATEDLIRRTF